jgi:hypothetical protein
MEDPLDKRARVIPIAAIRQLQGDSRRPQPRTLGSVDDPGLRSDEIEEYIRAHWKPE